MKLAPNLLEDWREFFLRIVFILRITTSIMDFAHSFDWHDILNQSVLNIKCQRFIEMLMPNYDKLRNRVWMILSQIQLVLPLIRVQCIVIVLLGTTDNIIAFSYIDPIFVIWMGISSFIRIWNSPRDPIVNIHNWIVEKEIAVMRRLYPIFEFLNKEWVFTCSENNR